MEDDMTIRNIVNKFPDCFKDNCERCLQRKIYGQETNIYKIWMYFYRGVREQWCDYCKAYIEQFECRLHVYFAMHRATFDRD
jgi:hypothetical protein